MELNYQNSTSISAETTQRVLAKNGIILDLEEVKNILELLYFLVNLSVDQILEEEEKLASIELQNTGPNCIPK